MEGTRGMGGMRSYPRKLARIGRCFWLRNWAAWLHPRLRLHQSSLRLPSCHNVSTWNLLSGNLTLFFHFHNTCFNLTAFASAPEQQRKEAEFIPPPRPPMQKLLTPNHAPYFSYNRVPWAFKLRKEVGKRKMDREHCNLWSTAVSD